MNEEPKPARRVWLVRRNRCPLFGASVFASESAAVRYVDDLYRAGQAAYVIGPYKLTSAE